jgi:hypothetical protein
MRNTLADQARGNFPTPDPDLVLAPLATTVATGDDLVITAMDELELTTIAADLPSFDTIFAHREAAFLETLPDERV